MTTTITVETHDWPVAVEICDDLSFTGAKHRCFGYREETQFVPANSKQQFHVTNSRSVKFRELPMDAKSLLDDPRSKGDTGIGDAAPHYQSGYTAPVAEIADELIAHVPV